MILDIVSIGDPVLRRPSAPVDRDDLAWPFVQELIASMVQTMRAPADVGIAAPQVGEGLRIVTIEDQKGMRSTMSAARLAELGRTPLPLQVLVNPVVEPRSDRVVEFFEGCLSVPGLLAVVPRWESVVVRALDETGAAVVLELTGWPARIVEHELDHLEGRVYLDRCDTRTITTLPNISWHWKVRPIDEVRATLGSAGVDIGPPASSKGG